ncbi:hypothetical protein KDA23_04965 [Candidatus Saccharibacteria bacterium]|nr:hypothetical protein [Candidatus Saccharibacteria bacterium]
MARQAAKQPAKRTSKKPVPQTKVGAKTSNVLVLSRKSLAVIGRNWRFFLWFMVVYAALNILLVHNFVSDVGSLRDQVQQLFGGTNQALTNTGTYVLLVANQSSASGAAGVYQYMLMIVGSLALIWAIRQFMSDNPPQSLRVRDAYYEGLYPLATFVLVLVVLALELLPLIFGGTVYSLVVTGGVASSGFEQVFWGLVFLGAIMLSGWLILRSIFALYIVTLPGMTPIAALQHAARVTSGYKLNMVRKFVFLFMIFAILSAIVMVPAIAFVPNAAQTVLFTLGLISLPVVHSYLYTMYREQVGE